MPRVPLIAIVDNDDSLRDSLDKLIRSVGFRAEGFASAEACLQARRAPETAYLMLAVRLTGMNGLELQQQLGAANGHIPLIFVTAYGADDVRARPDRWRGSLFIHTLPRGGPPHGD